MTKYSLTNKGVVFFFYFLLIVLGFKSVIDIPKQESPSFPSWNAVIVTKFAGASPKKIEELITEKIEEKMQELGELEEIKSTSQTNVSYVFIKIKESIEDVKPVWDKVREKLDDLRGKLPQGAVQPILNNDFGKTKSIVVTVTGDGFSNKELADTAKDLKKDLAQVKYVARVDLIGKQAERIFLEGSNAKMAELGINAQVIQQILIEQNILSPGGEIKVGPQTIRIQPTGEFRSVEDIKKTVISIPGNQNVFFLKDLFTIKREYIDPPRVQMRYMGKDAVGLIIEMQDNGQIINLGKRVKALLAKKQNELYLGIKLDILNFQPYWVSNKIRNFISNLWQAIAIVAVIMILLLGWREGFIISMLIPFTFLISINIMSFLGIPLHQISLAALIIALGMLVDNGIVMTESISQNVQKGMKTGEAAIIASKELSIPLLTSTATTVAAFLPIALAQSAVGIFTRSITYVVGIVLLSSFFVAMTLIPILCITLLKPKPLSTEKEKKPSFISNFISSLSRFYVSTMMTAIRFKYITIILVIVTFVGVLQFGKYVRSSFFPPSGRQQFLISFYLPEGTAYKETRRQVKIAEGYILKKYKKEIKNFAIYIGKGGARFHSATGAEQESTNYAQFVINNHNLKQTMKMIQELKPYFENNFADANAIIKVLESGPPVGAPIQIDVYGKDFDKLYAYTKTIQKELEKLQGVRNIRDNWGDLIPKLSIQVNQDQARRIGVSTHSISNALAAAFSGNRITDFREGDNSIPIIMRLNKLERANLKSIQNLTITTSQGNRVPLLQVVNIAMEWEAGKIRHKERKRTITIEAYVSEGASGKEILKLLEQRVKEKVKFEIGYGVNFGGEGKKSKEANDSIMKQVPIAFALMLLILVAQFGNVRKMLVILMTIPLSFMGVIFGLLLVDYPFGFMSFLGVISLAGIVVNNAILLLEQAGADVKAGKSELEAIISAGQRRAFPIILTTITTILGLLPLAFSGEMWGSLAVTIMGGLLISTILTLVVIPVIYSILFGVKYKAATS